MLSNSKTSRSLVIAAFLLMLACILHLYYRTSSRPSLDHPQSIVDVSSESAQSLRLAEVEQRINELGDKLATLSRDSSPQRMDLTPNETHSLPVAPTTSAFRETFGETVKTLARETIAEERELQEKTLHEAELWTVVTHYATLFSLNDLKKQELYAFAVEARRRVDLINARFVIHDMAPKSPSGDFEAWNVEWQAVYAWAKDSLLSICGDCSRDVIAGLIPRHLRP